jgi:hypothetical protein
MIYYSHPNKEEIELMENIQNIILFYFEDEQKHWMESGFPSDHVYIKMVKTLSKSEEYKNDLILD